MTTTIQVEERLKAKLDKLKIHHRETYNELIERLTQTCYLEDTESLKETVEVLSDPELIKGIKEALEEESKGIKGTTLEELRGELGL